jgi:hypothetical protein
MSRSENTAEPSTNENNDLDKELTRPSNERLLVRDI